jgi:hypothetical protein
MASNSKWEGLNRDNIAELICDPDSDRDICDCDVPDSDVSDKKLYDEEEQPVTSDWRLYKWHQPMNQTDRVPKNATLMTVMTQM